MNRKSLHHLYRPSNPDRLVPTLPEWELHVGRRCLFIVGPGPEAMRRCSSYSFNPGTAAEREIAERAVAILNERFREDKDASVHEILTVLVECGYEEEP